MVARRIGRAASYDVFSNADGSVVARNLSATEVVAIYTTSLSAEELMDAVAGYSFVDSEGYRAAAHFQILGGELAGTL
jgi:hypothetical protein